MIVSGRIPNVFQIIATDAYAVDRDRPRVEVELEEVVG